LVSPVENVYLKVFHVLHRAFTWGDWPLVEFVKGYATTFPEEAAAVYDVFLAVTRGVTVEREAPARHREPNYLAGLRERLLSGQARIDGNLGPPLWVVVPRLSLGMGVYRYFPVPSPLTFDLNAADVADLRSVPGVDVALAAATLKTRDERGAFDRVADLAAVPGMTPATLSRFASMRERMEGRLAARAPQRSNPTWMMNWLVRLLKGSYYLAAAWQFGRALVLAALLYALTGWTLALALFRGSRRGPAQPPAGRRGAWRRAARSLLRGMAVAAWPLGASVALYAAGIVPGPANMALVGILVGLGGLGARVVLRRRATQHPRASLVSIASTAAASSLIGLMY
jgi:hypothetical protein